MQQLVLLNDEIRYHILDTSTKQTCNDNNTWTALRAIKLMKGLEITDDLSIMIVVSLHDI